MTQQSAAPPGLRHDGHALKALHDETSEALAAPKGSRRRGSIESLSRRAWPIRPATGTGSVHPLVSPELYLER